MDKEKIDALYHLLREVSNDGGKSPGLTSVIHGLTSHLFTGGDYLRLIQYCEYYGENFLLQPTHEAILEKGWEPKRFVELGAGLSWLCRGLSFMFSTGDILTVDKRCWAGIDILADLETSDGILAVYDQLKDGDVIVMSDFLHCIENPEDILRAYPGYPMAILDYMPTNEDYADSYTTQLKRYGGDPIYPGGLEDMLCKIGRKADIKDLDPYVLVLIDKEA